MPCHHDHSNQKPDGWTNLSAWVGGTTSFVSDAYWFATAFDLVVDFAPDVLGVSYYAAGVGVFCGALSALGSTYAHRILNATHQVTAEDDHACDAHDHGSCSSHESDRSHTDGHGHSHSGGHGHSHTGGHGHSHSSGRSHVDVELGEGGDTKKPLLEKKGDKTLTVLQCLALVGDAASHTTDTASPLTFIVSLAGGKDLSRLTKGVTYGVSTLFGGAGSVANVRACLHAMQDANARERQQARVVVKV